MLRRGRRSGLYTFVAVHSTIRGPSLGGCRMWGYEDSREALRDALRLSRAMTFKSAVADLPLGGGKGVIMTPPGVTLHARLRTAALLDFGDTVESLGGRYITAEDVGTSSRDMRMIAQRTRHVAGLPRRMDGSGDPSPFTALGVESAIRACCERVFGSSLLRERTVAVIGLGHVGSRIAKRCARAGARLVLSDIDPRKRRLAEELGAGWVSPEGRARGRRRRASRPARWAASSTMRRSRGCAAGSSPGRPTISWPASRWPISWRRAEILWAPDFVANAGGIINIAEEQHGYDAAAARRRVRRIGEILLDIFDRADAGGTTPLAAAMDLAGDRLARPAPSSRRPAQSARPARRAPAPLE